MKVPVSALLLAGALAASACGGPPSGGGATAAPSAPPLRAWPEGRAAPMKITDELTLAVPLAFQRESLERAAPPPAAAAPGSAPPGAAHGEVHFDFFLPDFSGYTLENYRSDTDPNKVEVAYLHAGDSHEADPGAPGEYPPNMLERLLSEAFDRRHYRDQYGLRCYQGGSLARRIACYGRRDASSGEDIILTALTAPYPEDAGWPLFQARYYSQRYGGVRLEWRAHMSQLPRWREIDAQVWKFIDAWRVAPPGGGPAPASAPAAARQR